MSEDNRIPPLPEAWGEMLGAYIATPEAEALRAFVRHAYATEEVLPPAADLFAALRLCGPDEVRVVILGQDPYPTPGYAHGLAFSVNPPTRLPGSLRNIFREIADDVGPTACPDGDLRPWARQGVLLLNTVLTVRARESLSHFGKGWERFTDCIIRHVSAHRKHVVFFLWGKRAQAKKALIDTTRHLVLEAAHPSPLSARNGFFGCRCFSDANDWLKLHGEYPIRW